MRSSFSRCLIAFFVLGALVCAARAEDLNSAYALTPEMIKTIERERLLPSRFDARRQTRRRWKKAWIASWAAFAAANAVDVYSSRGKTELNPLLQTATGEFSVGRAAAIKVAAGGAFFAFQRWIIRRHAESNQYKTFVIANTGATAAMGAAAVHNYKIDRR